MPVFFVLSSPSLLCAFDDDEAKMPDVVRGAARVRAHAVRCLMPAFFFFRLFDAD